MRSVFSLMACVCLFFQVNGCSGGNHSSSGFVKPTVTVIPASSSISTARKASVFRLPFLALMVRKPDRWFF